MVVSFLTNNCVHKIKDSKHFVTADYKSIAECWLPEVPGRKVSLYGLFESSRVWVIGLRLLSHKMPGERDYHFCYLCPDAFC